MLELCGQVKCFLREIDGQAGKEYGAKEVVGMYGRSALINSSVGSHGRHCVRAGGFEDENTHVHPPPHREQPCLWPEMGYEQS